MQEIRERTYVPVIVRFDEEGRLRPILIEFIDGRKYMIDKVLDVRRAACESAGGVGIRYTVQIAGQESYLWYEKGRWFVAVKQKRYTDSVDQNKKPV